MKKKRIKVEKNDSWMGGDLTEIDATEVDIEEVTHTLIDDVRGMGKSIRNRNTDMGEKMYPMAVDYGNTPRLHGLRMYAFSSSEVAIASKGNDGGGMRWVLNEGMMRDMAKRYIRYSPDVVEEAMSEMNGLKQETMNFTIVGFITSLRKLTKKWSDFYKSKQGGMDSLSVENAKFTMLLINTVMIALDGFIDEFSTYLKSTVYLQVSPAHKPDGDASEDNVNRSDE